MDEDARKIGMLIAAFDAEHARLQNAVAELHRSGAQLRLEVKGAAREAVEVALRDLHPQIDRAGRTLVDLQRFSLWRAAWQHFAVAIAAIVITLLGVAWYVPPLAEITTLRTEREQLQASIEDLNNQGARMKHTMCGAAGEKKRFCVLVPKKPVMWDNLENRTEAYVVPVGY